ncbi:MAG: thymidylate synthase [Methanolobus sp.]|nr:thymidylate synthase [Methanolobus sp.]
MRVNIFYSGEFGKKVIGNLVNSDSFCVACGDLCDHCRELRPGLGNIITGIFELRNDLPDFVEEPMEYMPEQVPDCDLILAIDLNPDLLTVIPQLAEKSGAKGVIIPVDDSRIVPAGLAEQVKQQLEQKGIECECPKPFCALDLTGKKSIDDFVKLGFGKPALKVELGHDDEIFTHAEVLRDAPCGSTWFVAKKLKWSDVKDYKETISGAHHSYPCTASMERDPQIGDTILHEAGYIIRKSAEEAMENASRKNR